jgi:cytidine deaminase
MSRLEWPNSPFSQEMQLVVMNAAKLDPVKLDELIAAATRSSTQAYCPYSKFRVGAAVLAASGNIYTGCNVENVSYGLTICAERSATFAMIAAGDRDLTAIVIYTPTAVPSSPCGACRQVLSEFGPDASVVSVCDGPERINSSVRELLPAAFGPCNLVAE